MQEALHQLSAREGIQRGLEKLALGILDQPIAESAGGLHFALDVVALFPKLCDATICRADIGADYNFPGRGAVLPAGSQEFKDPC